MLNRDIMVHKNFKKHSLFSAFSVHFNQGGNNVKMAFFLSALNKNNLSSCTTPA